MEVPSAKWPIAPEEYKRLFACAQKVEDFQRLNEALARPPCSFMEYLAMKRLQDLERKLEREYWANYPPQGQADK